MQQLRRIDSVAYRFMSTYKVKGFCALCRSRCGCVSVVDNGVLTAIEPDLAHPSGKHLCVKGLAAPELVSSRERLLYPLKRRSPKGAIDPDWERISWDEALRYTAAQMRSVATQHGPEAVAFAVTSPSGTAVSDSIVWIQRLIRSFGSPNTIFATEICNWHKDFATAYTFGQGIGTPDFGQTGCLLLWGHNPVASWLAHAVAANQAIARGAKLVVVDPRQVGLAKKADEWLRVRPGTDGALALGLAGVMLTEGWYDHDFVAHWTNGPLLVRGDTGRFLTGQEVFGDAAHDSYVAVSRVTGELVACDRLRGRNQHKQEDLELWGAIPIQIGERRVVCRPALDMYRELCNAYPPQRVAALTGVPADQVRATARLLYDSRPVAYYAWSGVGQHTNATQTDRAICLLYALTGSYDAPGGNVLYEKPTTNDAAGLSFLTQQQKQKGLGLADRPLGPARNGWITAHDFCRAVLEEKPYPVKGLVGFGSNFLVSQPDAETTQLALSKLRFFVHCDLFLTPTARFADVVLPVASAWEREGLQVGFDVDQAGQSLVQLRPQVIKPRGEARSDISIVFDLAVSLGLKQQFFDGDSDAGLRHILEPSGVTLEELRNSPGGVSVVATTRYRKYSEARDGALSGFATPTGRVEIYSELFLDHGQSPLPVYEEPHLVGARRDLYPMTLTSTKSVQFCLSQHRSLPSLRRQTPQPVLEIHPASAIARGIAQGDWLEVETANGKMRARAKFNASLHPEVVCGQFGWWQACPELRLPSYAVSGPESANYNTLISSMDLDPISGSLPLRSYACQVRKASPA